MLGNKDEALYWSLVLARLDRCEVRGMLWGFLLFTAIGLFGYIVFRGPSPGDRNICSESCEEAGHSVHAFDVQRGCVCSDPYPEVPKPTRKWVQP